MISIYQRPESVQKKRTKTHNKKEIALNKYEGQKALCISYKVIDKNFLFCSGCASVHCPKNIFFILRWGFPV
jgi:hypothetical protein